MRQGLHFAVRRSLDLLFIVISTGHEQNLTRRVKNQIFFITYSTIASHRELPNSKTSLLVDNCSSMSFSIDLDRNNRTFTFASVRPMHSATCSLVIPSTS